MPHNSESSTDYWRKQLVTCSKMCLMFPVDLLLSFLPWEAVIMQGELCLPGSTNSMSHHLKWLQLERGIKQLEVSHIYQGYLHILNVFIVLQPVLNLVFAFQVISRSWDIYSRAGSMGKVEYLIRNKMFKNQCFQQLFHQQSTHNNPHTHNTHTHTHTHTHNSTLCCILGLCIFNCKITKPSLLCKLQSDVASCHLTENWIQIFNC